MSEVVITGHGACTSTAPNAAALWNQTAYGRGRTELTGYIAPFGPAPAVGVDGWSAAIALSQAAVSEAWECAGFGIRKGDASFERIGCSFSASKPLLSCDNDTVLAPDEINSFIASRIGAGGERRNVIAACATGIYSIAIGASWIEAGLCDVVLAGSVEPPAHSLYRAGFAQMGVLTPELVMRPFDRKRSGFIMNYGAGALVLESADHARLRGQPVLARVSGWGLGADSHGIVSFNSGGQRIADVIGRALARGKLNASQICHVNAHGTATVLNDRLETQALRRAFGAHADRLCVSATKSSTGHLLGAAGSVEAVLTVQALREQFVPPTRSLENPDPDCTLDYVAGEGRLVPIDHALTLSFGFGGSIGALVVSRC